MIRAKYVLIFLLYCIVLGMSAHAGVQAEYDFEINSISLVKNNVQIPVVEVGDLTVNIRITNRSSEAVVPYIVAMLCEGTREAYLIRNIEVVSTVSFEAGEALDVSLAISCTDASNKFIKVMVIEDFSRSVRKSANAFYPTGDELKLSSIIINGVPFEEFDKNRFTYTFSPDLGTSLPLEVNVSKICEGVNVSIQQPDAFPGVLTVTTSYSALPPVTYTIQITEGKPRVHIVINPSNWTVSADVKAGANQTLLYCDQPWTYWDFDGAPLEGSVAIQTAYSDATNPANTINREPQTWGAFTINKSADVYVLSYFKPVGNYMKWLTDKGYELQNKDDGTSYRVMYSNSTSRKFYLYKKSFSVAEGETTTVNLGNLGPYGDNMMYTALVKWTEDTMSVDDVQEVE